MPMKITGTERVIASLHRVADQYTRKAEQALLEGAKAIQQSAKDNAPVDEGNLENAIKIESERC